MKWRTNWNSNEFPPFNEHPTGPSVTVPDQTMSVSQLLQRHRAGLTFPNVKTPVYNYDKETGEALDLPDLDRLDLAELQELREAAQAEVQQIRDALNRQEQLKAKQRADQAEKLRLEQLEQARAEGAAQYPYKTTSPKKSSE